MDKITPEYVFSEFFKAQLKEGKMGLIPSFSGMNEVFRNKLGIDPVKFTSALEADGLIRVSGKKSKSGTPYVVLTLTDKGYTHFNLSKPTMPNKVVANKRIDGIWSNLTDGKPIVILRKKSK